MSQTVTGVQAPAAKGRVDGHTNYASRDFIVANGVTVNAGDFVYFSGGNITNATVTGDFRPLGMSEATVVGDGTKTATVCIDPNMIYLIKASSALAASNVGQYFDLQGSAGAQVINQGSADNTSGAFICLDVWTTSRATNFGIQGLSTLYGLFKIIESALEPKAG